VTVAKHGARSRQQNPRWRGCRPKSWRRRWGAERRPPRERGGKGDDHNRRSTYPL